MNPIFKDLFIFEIANNHQGSVEHGLKIIREMGKIARKHKIQAGVKFQYRDLDTFIHADYKNRTDVQHIPRFMSTRLSNTEFLTLLEAVRDEDLITIVTPFDETSVSRCLDHGVQILKVASSSACDWPLLDAVVDTHKPVIISTGGLRIHDIDKIVNFFTHRQGDFALMHCVSVYPTPNTDLHLNFVARMIRRYPAIPIGYSGHEAPDNLDVVKIAVSKGAGILERHVGVETDTIKLNKYSMNPEQTDAWVTGALTTHEICGSHDDEKLITQGEIESLLSLKRGIFAANNIVKGQQIKRSDVFFAMPCVDGQLDSGEFGRYRTTWIASRDYARNEAILEYQQPDTISMVRSVIHDAKGMLYEANIQIGSEFDIEISHHYGLEHFRQTGAILITLVNREYCKKLVIVLPNQKHPNHYHKQKEETFQLLWGDLELVLAGQERDLHPGDLGLIERRMWHSFTTKGGAIFEEISTKHIRDDSFYEDETINRQDLMLRKTIIEDW